MLARRDRRKQLKDNETERKKNSEYKHRPNGIFSCFYYTFKAEPLYLLLFPRETAAILEPPNLSPRPKSFSVSLHVHGILAAPLLFRANKDLERG